MDRVKLVLLAGITAVALAACGSTAKPLAGSRTALADHGPGLHGKVDDPRKNHFACLKQHHLPVSESTVNGTPQIQVGQPGIGPLITFLPTAGAAQDAQISGKVESAEVIGSALLYPNKTYSNSELKIIEDCTALGVQG
jgi:hypothetical protein